MDGDLVSGQQNPTGLYPGEYTVEVIDANGCVVVSEIIEVEVESNTKELQETGHLAIYPNPTSGKIFVDLELNQFYPVQIVIYDVAGKLIQQLPETTVFEETFVLDLSELANGVYNVKVKVAEELVIRKVVLVD